MSVCDDSDLEKIRESAGEDKDKCRQELFKVGTLAWEVVVVSRRSIIVVVS